MIKSFIPALLVIFLISCGGDSEDRKDGYSETSRNPEDSLFQEVMDGHDSAMAKMGKLSGYRKQLDKKIDSLKDVKSSAKAKLEDKFTKLNAELKEAQDEMNTWMQEFSIDSAQDDMTRRLEYLKSEKFKVEKVKKKIFTAVEKADSVLRSPS
jgi:flagellar capping protein FliD